MAKIPQDELDRLKSEIDLVALVRAKGVELKPHGAADLVGRCPFHDDKTPSLVVTPKKGLWHCLGACQKGGTVLDWVMQTEGISFRHAVAVLQEGKAAPLLSGERILTSSRVRRLESPLALDADDQTFLGQVTAYYHDTLKQSPAALDYLKRRGLGDPEAIATFKLGYADRSLGLRIPEKAWEQGAALRARLTGLGVYRESGHEHLAGSLVVPVLDAKGNTLNLYGRKITDRLRPGTAYHLYLPGPHRAVWNPACLQSKEVILCESLLDALSFWVNGFKNVTCAYGVEGFTEDMLSTFLRHGVKRVLIAYDRDEAGDRAAEKLGQKLLSEGLEALRVLFPHGMDANDYIQKVKPADKALRVLLQGAEWLGRRLPGALLLPGGDSVDTQTGEVTPPPATAETPSPLAAEPPAPSVAEPPPLLPHTLQGEDVHATLGERAYRVRGLGKNLSHEVLKVNLRASVGAAFYLDTLDLYSAKAREGFVLRAAAELDQAADVLKRDLGRLLSLLETLQEERIAAALKPQAASTPAMTAQEEAAAKDLAHAVDLPARIVADLSACGYLGEDVAKLTNYLIAVSRKLDDPLSVIIQSSSASGKSSLMDAVLAMVPPEDKLELSALTGQALFYLAKDALRHKLLSVAEDGGMADAAYSLKNLITDKKLRKAAPGKDPASGKMVTQVYEVHGPAAVMVSSTASEIEPELKNRCLVLTLNEDKEQTEAILSHQRFLETLAGKKEKKNREAIRTLHHNFQRLLRPLLVVNPFAVHLRFSAEQSRLRRDQMKYLGLMRTLALLHQHQRPIRHDEALGDYLEVALEDVELAGRLCAEVLGRTLDELAPQTRRLLDLLTAQVSRLATEKALEWPKVRLSRFDIRKVTRWSDTALKVHLRRLVELEYLVVHRSYRGLFEYELLYRGEGDEGDRFVLGLIDVEELRKRSGYAYDSARSGFSEGWSGENDLRSGSGQGPVSPRSGGGPTPETSLSAHKDGSAGRNGFVRAEKASGEKPAASYRNGASYPKNGKPAAARVLATVHKAKGSR